MKIIKSLIVILLLTSCKNDSHFECAEKTQLDALAELTLKSTPYDYDVKLRRKFIEGFRKGIVKSTFEEVAPYCIFTEDKESRAFAHGYREAQSLYFTIIENFKRKAKNGLEEESGLK